MKTRTLTLSILLLAVILAPLAMAEKPAPRGPHGGQLDEIKAGMKERMQQSFMLLKKLIDN